jgi:hypothetical protein
MKGGSQISSRDIMSGMSYPLIGQPRTPGTKGVAEFDRIERARPLSVRDGSMQLADSYAVTTSSQIGDSKVAQFPLDIHETYTRHSTYAQTCSGRFASILLSSRLDCSLGQPVLSSYQNSDDDSY